MRFDAVFFDSGGTLFGDGEVVRPTRSEVRDARAVRLAHCLESMGHVADADRLAELLPPLEQAAPGRFGPTYTYVDLMAAVAEALRLPLPEAEALICADAYVGPVYRSWLFPGTAETVAALSAAGLHVGLISNTYIPGFVADRMFRGVGLLRYLQTRVYSGEAGLAKPDPRIFKLAEQRAGLAGQRVLYVGDKPDKDVEPPRSLGWATALRRSPTAADSSGPADFHFRHTAELLDFVGCPSRPEPG